MKRRKFPFLVIASLMMTQAAGAASIKSDAVGSWRLISYTSTAADGVSKQNFGETPNGVASFDDKGNFMITIVRSDLPNFAGNNREKGTPEENQAVVRGTIAYFGTYTISETESSLIFKIEGATLPNWIGTTQRRGFSMPSRDELNLINAVASGGGSAEIKWKRTP